jgi:hypothetical protein
MMVGRLVLLSAVAVAGCDTASATSAGIGSIGCESTMRVSPATITLSIGDSVKVTASPSQCSSLPVPFSVFWRSSNGAVVSVDSLGGIVRALGTGQATVIASVVNDTIVKGAAVVVVTRPNSP